MALTKITSTNIGANAVTSALIANVSSATITSGLGYTPANKAGDTFTGAVAATTLTANGASAALTLADRSDLSKNFVWYVSSDVARLYNTGYDLLKVNTAGSVTMPYQPAFHAYATGNPSFAANGGTSSPMGGSTFDATEFNVGSHYSTSTSRFTAPIAGRYWFAFLLTCGSDPGIVQEAKLFVNGAERRRAYYRAGANIIANESTLVTTIFNLSAGDYVQAGAYTVDAFTLQGGQSAGAAHFAYFCGYLLG